jgi:hypothetical protein
MLVAYSTAIAKVYVRYTESCVRIIFDALSYIVPSNMAVQQLSFMATLCS